MLSLFILKLIYKTILLLFNVVVFNFGFSYRTMSSYINALLEHVLDAFNLLFIHHNWFKFKTISQVKSAQAKIEDH